MPSLDSNLVLLVPGFLAARTFYFVGFPSKRTDLELTLWSLMAAVVIGLFLDRLGITDIAARFVIGSLGGVAGGVILANLWLAVANHNERLRQSVRPKAWDSALDARQVVGSDGTRRRVAPWVQVWTTGGRTVQGWVHSYALSAETEAVDVYLCDPIWVTEDGEASAMTGVDGVLIPASAIELVQVLTPVTEQAEARRTP